MARPVRHAATPATQLAHADRWTGPLVLTGRPTMSDTMTASAAGAIRPFRIDIPQGEIDELRRRIEATRWPTRELVTDRSQGVQLAAIQSLARYWATDYDWRRCEARLNALPQFK